MNNYQTIYTNKDLRDLSVNDEIDRHINNILQMSRNGEVYTGFEIRPRFEDEVIKILKRTFPDYVFIRKGESSRYNKLYILYEIKWDNNI
jgi:hypothetical protein